MAFNSTSSITILKPVVIFRVTDWVINSVLLKPTLVFKQEWTVNSVLPIVTATTIIPTVITSNIILPKPTLTGLISFDNLFVTNYIFKKPEVNFSVSNSNLSTITFNIPKPSLVSGFGLNITGHLNSRLSPVNIVINSVLTATTTKQTWVFNTITTAHSRYTNYNFNSFFKLGSKNYGINANGDIYELVGDKDFVGEAAEANIESTVILPATSFDEQTLKACSDAIVYGRGDGYTEIQVVLDEQQARTGYMVYFDDRTGMHRKRVKIPKGLKGNIWQFIIKNVEGSAFDINMFEIFVKPLQRLKW